MAQVVLLDWDGVLCDSLSLYIELYEESCRRHGKTLPVSGAEAFKGWYNPRWEENYYEMGFSEEEFQEVLVFAESHLQYSRTSLYPGVPEMLRSLSRDWPIAIVSTTPSHMIRERLRQEGLEELFTEFTGGEDGSSEKIQKVADTLRRLGRSQGVMVGDTPLDIEAGKASGLATVGVTYGWVLPSRVEEARPSALVRQPDLLEQAIRDQLRS